MNEAVNNIDRPKSDDPGFMNMKVSQGHLVKVLRDVNLVPIQMGPHNPYMSGMPATPHTPGNSNHFKNNSPPRMPYTSMPSTSMPYTSMPSNSMPYTSMPSSSMPYNSMPTSSMGYGPGGYGPGGGGMPTTSMAGMGFPNQFGSGMSTSNAITTPTSSSSNPLPSIQTFRNTSSDDAANNDFPSENSLDELNFDPSTIIGDTDATNLSVSDYQNGISDSLN